MSSSSKPKSATGSRRTANKQGKRTPSGAATTKPKLEPLPEILHSPSASEAQTPRVSPTTSVRSSRRREKQKTNEHKAFEAAYFGGEQPLLQVAADDDGEIYNNTSVPASGEPSPLAEKPSEVQRARSRTTTPGRGRGREHSGVFARRGNLRPAANRPNTVVGGRGDIGSIFAHPSALTPSDELGMSGINSAGLIAERQSPSGDVNGTSANSANSTGSGHRRRGHTLEPDQLSLSRFASDGIVKAPQTATASHFHVSTSNASLANHPVRAVIKKGSASSSATTSTVEIDSEIPLQQPIQSKQPEQQQQQQQQQGQLARMLVSYAPENAASLRPSPEAPRALTNNVQTGNGASSGRPKRGGSAGDSRLSHYKGVFGTRMRSTAGDQAHSGSPDDHPHHQHQHNIQSTSAEMPSAFISTSIDDTADDIGAGAGHSSGSIGESPGAAHRTISQTTSAHVPNVRISKPSTVQVTVDNTVDTAEPLAKSTESATNGHIYQQNQHSSHQHQRRESVNMSGQQRAATQTGLPPIGSLSINGRVTSGADSVRGDMSYADASRGNSFNSDNGYDDHGATLSAATAAATAAYTASSAASLYSAELHCPWRPDLSHTKPNPNRTLKGTFNRKWANIAAAPGSKPVCAVAGHEGLVLLNMGPEVITQRSQPSAVVRRWSMAMVFKDVIWKPSDYIATGSNDGTVMIWDPNRLNDSIVRKYHELSRSINRLTHKPDDPFFIYAAFSDTHLLGWDVRVHNSHSSFRIEMPRAPQDISCNPIDSNAIAAISSEGQISLWDIRKPNQFVKQFHAHSAYNGQCLTWHPKGRFIASGASDQTIKIWDISSANSSKFNVTPFCSIHTVAVTTNRLQWRPGYDTQISSSAFSQDSRLQVWDMRNPNHSIMYHDLHSSPIGGFVWVDEDTVWSTSRAPQHASESNIVQCNMQTDAVITAGLVGSTSADFSSSHQIAVATGAFHPRAELESPPVLPRRQGAGAPPDSGSTGKSTRSDDSSSDALNLVKFQTNLPESFVDEHLLDSDMASRATTICYLAVHYRFDPDAFTDCCENNARAAAHLGIYGIAKFWQFLAATFGDSLPLKSRRKPKKNGILAEPSLDTQQPQQQQRNDDEQIHTVGSGLHISMDNSRASSIMFPSRSVATDPSSDEEPYFKYGNALSPLSASRHSSSVSLTHLRTAAAGAAKHQPQRHLGSGSGARLERGFMSLSHTNLQQASLSAKKSRIPSPLVQSASNSFTGRMNNFTSEPATPATRHANHHTFLSNTNNPSLASMASAASQRLSRNAPSPSRKYLLADETPGGTNPEAVSAQYLEFLSAPASFISHGPPIINPVAVAGSDGGSRVNERIANIAGCELIDGKPACLSKLELREMRNTTKAELKLVIDSCAYYADKGDVQTAVTVALLMRNFIKLSRWKIAERWFASYIELLDLHMAFAPATEIILASPFESVKEELLSNIFINLSCSQCGSALSYVADMGFTRCVECQHKANSCVVCEQPTDGRFIWCQGCGHGGHAEHISDWFDVRKQHMCPSGCGHVCQPVLSTEYA